MTMGTGDWTIRPVAVFRLCGQPSRGPSGVDAQSYARIRFTISPAPFRKLTADAGGAGPCKAVVSAFQATWPLDPMQRGRLAKASRRQSHARHPPGHVLDA